METSGRNHWQPIANARRAGNAHRRLGRSRASRATSRKRSEVKKGRNKPKPLAWVATGCRSGRIVRRRSRRAMCAYRCAYTYVSAGGASLQLVASSHCPICRSFLLASGRCSSFARTFNPRGAGSSPARPMLIAYLQGFLTMNLLGLPTRVRTGRSERLELVAPRRGCLQLVTARAMGSSVPLHGNEALPGLSPGEGSKIPGSGGVLLAGYIFAPAGRHGSPTTLALIPTSAGPH